jgi:hypothetical protein
MRRRALIVLALTVLAGCGGGGERLTRGELISQGDQECRDQRARHQSIGATSDVRALALKGDQLLASDQEAVRRFARLRPPAELESDFDAYLTLLRQSLDIESRLVAAAKRGDVAELRRRILELQSARPVLGAAARKLGFRVCSQA